ncbi:hypothetical protein BU15DRAFT_74096 [Melanogaster broomeanus]|nr:hypothetical protein BU15DRAFT_74096 [Melanogaster broomeanus]
MYEEKWRGWDIQQVDSTGHTSRDEDDTLSEPDCRPPFNDPSLPRCVVVFEVVHYEAPILLKQLAPATGKVVLRATDYLELLGNQSVRILLETELSLTPDILSMSLCFTHSTKLYSPTDLRAKSASRYNLTPPFKFQITRVVRVLPTASALPGITNGGLPTELLLLVFREVARAKAYTGRRRDLLAFGLVCRKWTCSLDLLLWDFQDRDEPPHWYAYPPDIHALGRAVKERPCAWALYQAFQHSKLHSPIAVGVSILRTTRNLKHLELHNIDVGQKNVLASALYDLHELHTFTLGIPFPALCCEVDIGFMELADCLASWTTLKSFGVFNYVFLPGMAELASLRLPVCALMKLEMKSTYLSDKELVHIMSSSLNTLEQVVFDTIYGVTDAGIRTCLDAISHNVTSLEILRTPVHRDDLAQDERALDATIDKMVRLRSLDIGGDVATELMLQRRAKLFCATRGDRNLRVDSAHYP